MDESERVDTVVIGSGMGGMTAARLLQDKRGDRVLMLEAHAAPGGMTHEFRRRGGGRHWSFASGLHYLGRDHDGFGTKSVIRYLTGDRIQWHDLPERYDVFDWGAGRIGLPSSPAQLEAELSARFPDEAPAIRRYLRRDLRRAVRGLTAVQIANSLPDPLRRRALPLARALAPLALRATAEVMAARFRSPELRAILSFQWGDYGRSPGHTAFGFHAMIATHYAAGATFPIGGAARIGAKTLDMITRAGGTVRAGHRVTGITLAGGRATGVTVRDLAAGRDYRVEADTVVSAIGARQTAALLPAPIGPALAAELDALGRNVSACILFLGLSDDPATLGFDGANHWLFDGLDHDAAGRAAPGEGPLYLSFGSMKDPAARHHAVEVIALTEPAPFDRWAALADARTDPAYGAEKARIAARILDRLEARHPGFRALVAHQELATPLTFGTYQQAADGAFYGLPASAARATHRLASPRWPVPGLVLAGQDAMTPGILGAAAGGVRAAGILLGRDETRALMAQMQAEPARPARAGEPWNGFLKVTRAAPESPTVRSLHLALPEGGRLPFAWAPGQFMTVHVPTEPKPTLRSYSISSACPEDGADSLRLTVKAQPGGRASPFLHDEIRQGDLMEVSGPFGAFTFDPEEAERLVLIGGGVGVTPFAAILDDLAARRAATRVTALFAFRTEEEILFAAEMARWRDAIPGLDLHLVLSGADAGWSGARGRVDAALLRRLCPDIAAAQVHVCGPEGLMDAMAETLPQLGVAGSAIRTERFTAGTGAAAPADGPAITVTFARAGRAVEARIGATIMDVAQEAGIDLPLVCGAGACGACRMRLLAGAVKHPAGTALAEADREAGYILACQARPRGDVTVEA